MRKRLEELDELRYSDAQAALDEVTEIIEGDDLEPTLLPLAMGVAGSALRLLLDYDQAEAVLEEALGYADELDDHATAGNLHQRLSMVWWARLNFDTAYVENCKALARHLDGGNQVGVAKSFVDRGVFVGSMGFFPWSTRCFLRAIESLPESEVLNRISALHGIAHNLLETGDLDGAIKYLKASEELDIDPQNRAKHFWVNGVALSAKGMHKEAVSRLHDALEIFLELEPLHAALVTIDLCKALINAGHPKEAHRGAATMGKFAAELKHHRAAEVAALELTNLGLAGAGLSEALLEELKQIVREALSAKKSRKTRH